MILNLSSDIEQKRSELINVGMTKGFSDERTIIISQELDELINLSMQHRIFQQNNKTKRVTNERLSI